MTTQQIKAAQGRARQRALADRRAAAGQRKITSWLGEEARNKLDVLVAKTGKTRDQVIEDLILGA
ncbi:TPA: hypothetical protein SMF87_004555 [Serratia marcescens]|nr:hypothetical protein [Serratia marcescens]